MESVSSVAYVDPVRSRLWKERTYLSGVRVIQRSRGVRLSFDIDPKDCCKVMQKVRKVYTARQVGLTDLVQWARRFDDRVLVKL